MCHDCPCAFGTCGSETAAGVAAERGCQRHILPWSSTPSRPQRNDCEANAVSRLAWTARHAHTAPFEPDLEPDWLSCEPGELVAVGHVAERAGEAEESALEGEIPATGGAVATAAPGEAPTRGRPVAIPTPGDAAIHTQLLLRTPYAGGGDGGDGPGAKFLTPYGTARVTNSFVVSAAAAAAPPPGAAVVWTREGERLVGLAETAIELLSNYISGNYTDRNFRARGQRRRGGEELDGSPTGQPSVAEACAEVLRVPTTVRTQRRETQGVTGVRAVESRRWREEEAARGQ